MFATHVDAELRYEQLRKQALDATNDIIHAQGVTTVRASTITGRALIASKRWERSMLRQVDWDWFDGYDAFKFRYPKRVEMALWDTNQLIGLSLGRPTYNGTALRLDFVEASPLDLGQRPSIVEFVLLGYEVYARLMNAQEVRIMSPVNNKVRSYYQRFGYMSHGDYLVRSIT
jgi:hypothetical protein